MTAKKGKPAADSMDPHFIECVDNVLINWQRKNEEFGTRLQQLRGLLAFENDLAEHGPVPWFTLMSQVLEGLVHIHADLEYGRSVLFNGLAALRGEEFENLPF
mgnify:FL=1